MDWKFQGKGMENKWEYYLHGCNICVLCNVAMYNILVRCGDDGMMGMEVALKW